MDPLPTVVGILTAMISPAVLISACGTLIISTSSRASRVNDRLNEWASDYVMLMEEESDDPVNSSRRSMIFRQLDRLTSRGRLLQLSLMAFYISLALFVATSVALGVVAAGTAVDSRWQSYGLLPVIFALIGGGGLLAGCMLMISEARLALAATNDEMDFIWGLGKHHASDELMRSWRERRSSFLRLPRFRSTYDEELDG